MSLEIYYCSSCDYSWEDDPGFWSGWLSECPKCDRSKSSLAQQRKHHRVDDPPFHDPEVDHLYEPFPTGDEPLEDSAEKNDLNASSGDEPVEALGEEDTDIAGGADTDDSTGDSDGDGDGDSDGDGAGDGDGGDGR